MRQEVEADCLAALMVLNKSLEPTPEPFRMQPDVQLVVPFEEYLKFVSSLPTGCDLLHFPTDKLQKALSMRNEQSLLKSFYVDMALAVCKELSFAERKGKGATVIRHDFQERPGTKRINVTNAAVRFLCPILDSKGFGLPAVISQRNLPHWNYACKLIQDASGTPTRWVEKI